MSPHLTLAILVIVSLIVSLIVFAAATLVVRRKAHLSLPSVAAHSLTQAAAREFEGAKPALIHACDAEVDKLPDNVDITALEAKARLALSVLLTRLLAANPLLSGAGELLLGLLPLAFSALPKTLDVAGYKSRLKDELHKLISEARL